MRRARELGRCGGGGGGNIPWVHIPIVFRRGLLSTCDGVGDDQCCYDIMIIVLFFIDAGLTIPKPWTLKQ